MILTQPTSPACFDFFILPVNFFLTGTPSALPTEVEIEKSGYDNTINKLKKNPIENDQDFKFLTSSGYHAAAFEVQVSVGLITYSGFTPTVDFTLKQECYKSFNSGTFVTNP